MKGWMIRWLINIVALLLIAKFIPNFDLTIWAAIVGSIFLGIINAAIRPLLLIFPRLFNLINLGVLTILINGFMLWVTAATIKGFELNGLGRGLLVVILFSLLSFISSWFISDNRKYWR